MKCTCDSKDLFNYGCRCGCNKVETLAKDYGFSDLKIGDIGSMHPGYLLSLSNLGVKMITKEDLRDALDAIMNIGPSNMLDDLANRLWNNLK